ncbi:MAG: DUF3368 domain-containing protein [Candidatus Schekmanbacteria bacterium]|nr:DUF3368 domain-containing protein [Candidatus Schekmanbacteria bacterium]
MPKVVSNSSPLIHLAKIGRLDLLKDLFGTIIIPESVYRECVAEGKGREEITLIRDADWLLVSQVNEKNLVRLLLTSVDAGESEAIALALEIGADLILLDDSDAREKARLYGLTMTGTIGVLLRARREGKLSSFTEELDKLERNSFRISKALKSRLLTED